MKTRKSFLILISLFFLFAIIPLTLAQNITLSYDDEVETGKDFSITFKLVDFASDVYDVKIDITSKTDGTRICKILNNGEWKSTYYYVSDAINANEEKEFTLKADSYIGDAKIEVKIRNTAGTTSTFSDYEITFIDNKNEEEKNETIEEEKENKNNKNDEDSNEELNINYRTNETSKLAYDLNNQQNEIQIIKLNNPETKDIKTINNTQGGNKRKLAIYSLILFCILLSCLIILKKLLKNRKNEFK